MAKYFSCSFDYVKRSFHRTANFLISKIGRILSEESVLQLINAKCLWILLYGLKICAIKIADLRLLDFIINRLFWKCLRWTTWIQSGNVSNVFILELPTVRVAKRATKFPLEINDNWTANKHKVCCSDGVQNDHWEPRVFPRFNTLLQLSLFCILSRLFCWTFYSELLLAFLESKIRAVTFH